eukprot:gene9002-11428_t
MKKMNTWRLIWVAALIVPLAFTGCKKDDPEEPADTTFKGNDSLKTDIFQSVNGAPLGDILQSMTYINDRAYIVVNNSGKIEI